MKTKYVVIVLGYLVAMLLLANHAWAQTYPLGTPLTAYWEGADNEGAAGVDHYEVRVDNGTWATQGQPVPQATYSYALPQALLTIGAHTVSVRSCAAATCGTEATVAITIQRPTPGLPRNPRVLPTPPGARLTVPQAIDRAHAYALLILDRTLTPLELQALSLRHPPMPPTRESVIALLDDVFAEFVIQP